MTKDEILRRFESSVSEPVSARELLQLLKVPRDARVTFRRHLRSLAADGLLVQVRGHRYALPGKMDVVVGVLQMHPDGYGFVVPEHDRDRKEGDVHVSADHLKEAMHGDRVAARIERRSSPQRRDGRIVRIIERGHEHVVGRVEVDHAGRVQVIPHEKRLVQRIAVLSGDTRNAAAGDMVDVEITHWPTATRGPIGRVVEVFGSIDTPGVDTRVIIRKHGIPDAHSAAAVAEAAHLGVVVRERELDGRSDFRGWPTVTIDGEDARDFDDAITLERLPNGHFWLGVHIADVAHYVHEGSALDAEAFERGTSVYFPERAVHMFPAELATGLCSLRPDVDRLVQSCLMEVNDRGDVVRYEVHDGVIRSGARMTYTAVNAVLTERDPETLAAYAGLVPLFERMRELFEVLNKRRHRRGSIDFDLPESEIILDDEGRVAAVTASERNVAHRIIEEFMLLANETVAAHFDAGHVPALYRIHEAPDPAKVAEFEEFVASLGYSLAAAPGGVRPGDFQRLVERISGTPVERPIAFLMLRTMQQARYASENVGHFGLAAPTYTHFTSPIRRYPDLVVHRLLRESRHGAMTAARLEELTDTLPEIGRHTSARERRAMEAERELVQWKKVRFMADKVGEEYDGYVTGVSAFGLFVELVEHFVEGLVHVSTMADDYYRYLDTAHVLRGEHSHKVFRLGDRVRVQVLRVDTGRRLIDLGLVELLEAVRAGQVSPGARRSRARPKSERSRHAPRQPKRGKVRRRASRR
ncbi:MAG: ribonuclease R [Acidobacteria bacterium]|nr:ribonuclease R [Acidobacteriota bacterium]